MSNGFDDYFKSIYNHLQNQPLTTTVFSLEWFGWMILWMEDGGWDTV
jgi:hypothetical protein